MKAGETLGGRFEIIGELGHGATATVYLATDLMRQEQVALKVLHEHLAGDPSARKRLRREVQAASRIIHPRALVPHEIHDLDGRLCLAMPVHRGQILGEAVIANGPFSESALRRLATDLAGALGAAHAQGVVHRDLTPNNVMIEPDGHATLMDFGLARVQELATQTHTAAGAGTWGYAAPEAMERATADPRSDLYGLGAILYLAATGKAPFDGPSPAAILRRQLSSDVMPLDVERPDLPADLVQVIMGLLAKDPDKRPMGARDVEDALIKGHGFNAEPEITADEPAPDLTLATPSEESPPRSDALATPARRALPEGEHSVVIQRRRGERSRYRALRRRRGPVGPKELAAPERTLLQWMSEEYGVPVDLDALPSEIRHRTFRLVNGVDKPTAVDLTNKAKSLGLAGRVRSSGARWQAPHPTSTIAFIMPIVLFLIALLPLLARTGTFRLAIPVVGSFLMGLTFLFFAIMRQVRIRGTAVPTSWRVPAGQRVEKQAIQPTTAALVAPASPQPASHVPPPQATITSDPASRVLLRTKSQLTALANTMKEAEDELADTVLKHIRRAFDDLQQQVRILGETAEALRKEQRRNAELGAAEAVSRIHARLTRLKTLERAGETVDAREQRQLEAAIKAHDSEQTARDESEALMVRITARLLEIGAAASQATRDLRGDADLNLSVADLLDSLRSEARAAAMATKEVKEHVAKETKNAEREAARLRALAQEAMARQG